MRRIKLPIETEINEKLIEELIENHNTERDRILRMKDYYANKNSTIMNREYKDNNKPSNRLSHGYASYITDNFVGYLMGQPISYKSDNKDLLDKLNVSFLYNDEIDNNITLAQEQSIVGYAYELLYRDEEANARFKVIDTEDIIVVYENTIEEKELFAIRCVYVDDKTINVYVYDNTYEYIYLMEDGKIKSSESPQQHYFSQVPVCTYENNRQRLGDFEKVLSLIDAYDLTNSDTANDFEYFTDALLVISGVVMDNDNSQPLNFKDNRVLNFADTTSKAEYLIKNINDSALENYKNRLDKDILKFANVVNLSDESFSGNSSGISLKLKMQSMENIASIKESKIRKGLMKRIELLVSFLGIKTNTDYAYTEIIPVFTRNMPSNDVELINTVKGLIGTDLVSLDTLRGQIPFVEDLTKEKEALEKEREEAFIDYDNFEKGEQYKPISENVGE